MSAWINADRREGHALEYMKLGWRWRNKLQYYKLKLKNKKTLG